MPNDSYTGDEITINDDNIIFSAIDPLKNEILEIEGVENENKEGEIEVSGT